MNTLVRLLSAAAALFPAVLAANTAPTVVIQSASMRPGTTLMDVVYRVNDPDDATVKTRALAFIGGVRSFANLIKPVTFAEGTAAKLGDAILSNTNHTLTWDAAADWDIDLGQIKFEILAMDGRGLLPIDWITIPAAGGNPALTISKDTPADAAVLNAFFWQYAAGDTGLALINGVLGGSSESGVFNNVDLVSGTAVNPYGAPFIFKRMNLAEADPIRVNDAINARAGLLNTNKWHALNGTYDGISIVVSWGGVYPAQDSGQFIIPAGLNGATAMAAGYYQSLVLKSDGTVVGWGLADRGASIPAGLSGVTSIAAGSQFSLALKSDGTVVQWGNAGAPVPAGLSGVIAVAAGDQHGLALKSDGTVVAWNTWPSGPVTVPSDLNGVTAIAAHGGNNLALKSNGTVFGWHNSATPIAAPAGLSDVTAIAAGENHGLALKSDGTVVAWGDNTYGQTAIPAGLSGVAAITAGYGTSIALKSDGTVLAWGDNSYGQTTIPSGLTGVTNIAVGRYQCFALKSEAQ
jgi:hypothetical protein